MTGVNKTEIFNAPIQNVFKVLADFESYPEYMDGVKNVKIVSNEENKFIVEYDISIIKKFQYQLELIADAPTKLTWSFKSGDIFSKNSGAWTLKDLGDGKTEVNYSLDVEFKVKVPGMISKKLVSSNLPSLMKSVEKRAKNL